MNKKDLSAVMQKVVSDAAIQALTEGKGARAIGGNNGINVNDSYKLVGVDYVEQLFPPRGMEQEDFNALSKEEQETQGRIQGWFTFKTNNGNLSFAAVLGDKDMYTPEFWEGVDTKAADFDVTKIFQPSARTAEAWITENCDNLIGKTIKCVAVKEYQRGNFDAKARAFVVL